MHAVTLSWHLGIVNFSPGSDFLGNDREKCPGWFVLGFSGGLTFTGQCTGELLGMGVRISVQNYKCLDPTVVI